MERFEIEYSGPNKEYKRFMSRNLNYLFNLRTGTMMTWGATEQDDPQVSPFGPFLADIEITTKCNGINGKLCRYCYKANTPNGENMSLDTFKTVIGNLNANKQLTQVAFGLGSTAEENPDLWPMCDWLRSQNVIPNGTVANISLKTADKIAHTFGACAVSCHMLDNADGFEVCYDSVDKLTRLGLKQTNIHYMICEETYAGAMRMLHDAKHDHRLYNLRAIVFLSLKSKGRAVGQKFTPLSAEKYANIVEKCLKEDIGFGFDSCGACKIEQIFADNKEKFRITDEQMKQTQEHIERCESGLFSIYVNTDGHIFPCSFIEGTKGWTEGLDVSKPRNFIDEVWNSPELTDWRTKLLANNRACPVYAI